VEPIPDGRILFFMDLRPDHCYMTRDDNDGEEREVVACAIVEVPGISYRIPPDRFDRLPMPAELEALVESGALGEGEPSLDYYVVELEAHGAVVGDWWVDDLDGAKEVIEDNILESRTGPV
jgi:hypothetical protein